MQTQPETRVNVFEEIFLVFLGLGTLVGVVVIAYTLYNAYKYRDHDDRKPDEDLPTLGELPTGGGSGKKLFVSFGLSAIIVISLVVWTYGMLLYVEEGPDGNPGDDAIEVDVEGFAFGWDFYYENGVETGGELVVPEGQTVWLNVTATDVWHSFGITEQRVKADAIPGEYDETWFIAEEEGEYLIECFELCGPGHSAMEATLNVTDEATYEEWLEEQAAEMEEEEEADEEADEDEANGDDEADEEADEDEANGDDEADDANGDDEADDANGDDENGDDENGDEETDNETDDEAGDDEGGDVDDGGED
ncbi:cytochrome c oxidase subunit II [Natrononativus amylolyticus]|uniref:cytochrome c oxidase subunit II n=1 Tax=Natrononativus amylolyticus TaxID=2963434 RepID=UPI0020CE53A6|nr:cytochrome c oxidase subunit II [Natrononativus amylolyticus]